MSKKISMLALILLLAISSSIVAGCASNGIEVEVKTVQEQEAKSRDGIDPLTRGKLRRQILDDMQGNIDAWLKGDIKGLEKSFTGSLLTSYKEQIVKLHAKGQDKVRIHENQELEVTELIGDTAKVKYKFIDKSYFITPSTKAVVKEASGAESTIVIEVKKQDGRWKINSMIGAGEATL